MSWLRIISGNTQHVVPVDDLKDHLPDNCWCKPCEYLGVLVHNSMDRREEYEPDYMFGTVRQES